MAVWIRFSGLRYQRQRISRAAPDLLQPSGWLTREFGCDCHHDRAGRRLGIRSDHRTNIGHVAFEVGTSASLHVRGCIAVRFIVLVALESTA